MAEREIKTSLKMDGEKEYKTACKDINNSLRVLGSEMKVLTAEYGTNNQSTESLTKKQDILKKQFEEQSKKVSENEKMLALLRAEENQNVDAIARFEVALNNSKVALIKTEHQLKTTEKSLQENTNATDNYKNKVDEIDKSLIILGAELNTTSNAYRNNAGDVESLTKKSELLNKIQEQQSKKVEELSKAYHQSASESGELSDKTIKLKLELEKTKQAVVDTEKSLSDVEKEMKKVGNATDGFGNTLKFVSKAFAVGIATISAAAGTAAIALSKQALSSYADYEQLTGGIETLFGDAYEKVMEDANDAFKTSGLTANAYMETVTGFSASLISSLGGDTKEAATLSNRALTDMSDNVNKMGSSMESVQNAYAGFSKQNYTMLDNLKLGYGGTKKEMQRLLDDATSLSGVKFDIDSYADIIKAIGIIQDEMGITGTTAKEAEETISGAIGMTQASWGNLVTGLGDSNADIGKLATNLVNAFQGVIKNITPVIENIAKTLPEGFKTILNEIGKLLPSFINVFAGLFSEVLGEITKSLPMIINMGVMILKSLVDGIIQNIPIITDAMVQIIMNLSNGIIVMLPMLLEGGLQIILGVIQGISEGLPELIPKAIEIISIFITSLLDNIPLLIDCALSLNAGLAEGILKAIPIILKTIPEIIKGLVNGLLDKIPEIIETGIILLTALLDDLPTIILEIVEAVPKIVTAISDDFGNNINKIIDVGVKLFIALIENLPTIIFELVKVAPQIVDAIVKGFHSCMASMVAIGTDLLKGVWEGMQKMGKWLTSKVKGLFGDVVNNVKNFLGINSPSKLFEEEIGKNIVLGTEKGIRKNAKKAEKAAKEMAKKTYEASVLWIKNYRNETGYIISEELAMWQALGKKYTALSKEKVEIDKQVADLQTKIQKEKEAEEKKAFEFSKHWIDKKKKAGLLSLTEEFAAWERVQQRYAVGTQMREEAEKNILEIQKQIATEREKISDKMIAVENKYTDAVNQKAKAIYNSYGLFAELKEKEEVSSQTLKDNLAQQVEALKEWANNIETLSKKGIEDGLLTELRGMGVSASSEIEALSKMTEKELKAYEQLWKEKNRLAKEQAIIELKSLRIETNEELEKLKKDLEKLIIIDGASFIQQFAANLNVRELGLQIDKDLAGGMSGGMHEITNEIRVLIKNVVESFVSQKPIIEKQGIELDKYAAVGMTAGIPEINKPVPQIVQSIINQFLNQSSKFNEIGKNMMRGIGQGITNMSGWLSNLIDNYIGDMIKQVENRLDIHSPSKVFADIGSFMAEGLGIGFAKEMKFVKRDIKDALPIKFDINNKFGSLGAGKIIRTEDKKNKKSSVQVIQNIYTPQYDYVSQQREASKQFKLIARMI